MTLKEWVKSTGTYYPTHPTTEKKAVSLIYDKFDSMRIELFHLSDYVVSSCCGIVIWLVPRKSP